jgi:hypothetical protein
MGTDASLVWRMSHVLEQGTRLLLIAIRHAKNLLLSSGRQLVEVAIGFYGLGVYVAQGLRILVVDSGTGILPATCGAK